jgi:hypothetical protein
MNKTMVISSALALALSACSSSQPSDSDHNDFEMSMPSDQMDGKTAPAESQDNNDENNK